MNFYEVIPRFYNLHLNLYDVIGDVTDRPKKSEITFFSNNSVQADQNTWFQASQSNLV